MSLIWAVPPLAAVAAMILIVIMVRDLASAARDLRQEADRYAELQPALAQVRTEIDRSRRTITRLRHR